MTHYVAGLVSLSPHADGHAVRPDRAEGRLALPLTGRVDPLLTAFEQLKAWAEDPVPGWRAPPLGPLANQVTGWFGEGFDTLVYRLHRWSSTHGWGEADLLIEGRSARDVRVSLDSLLERLLAVARSVEAAARRGIVHGALHPRLVRVDEYGEARVAFFGSAWRVDWSALPDGPIPGWGPEAASLRFVSPDVGARCTPAGPQPQPPDDIYGLGALLYFLLTGSPPYEGAAHRVWARIRSGTPPPPIKERLKLRGSPPPVPPGLIDLCNDAMLLAPERRPDAASFVHRLAAWLAGPVSGAEETYGQILKRMREIEVDFDALEARWRKAQKAAEDARIAEGCLLPWASIEDKRGAWGNSDKALREQERVAQALDDLIVRLRHLRGQVEEQHRSRIERLLVRAFELQLDEAERRGDLRLYHRAQSRLREHVGRVAAVLSATAQVEMRLATPCDRVEYSTYRPFDPGSPGGARAPSEEAPPTNAESVYPRRWVIDQAPREPLGASQSFLSFSLPAGNHIVHIVDGGTSTDVPIRIAHGHRPTFVPPEARNPTEIALASQLTLGPDDRYVPPGWFILGGDEAAIDSLPYRRCWLGGFIAKAVPVTRGEYSDFLNERLSEIGRKRLVEELLPPPSGPGGFELVQFEECEGSYQAASEDGDDMPVTLISWYAAQDFARWLTARDGLTRRGLPPWRLLRELEWEKAARGPFGWHFPWGNRFEATWTHMNQSTAQGGKPVSVTELRRLADKSPYGIHALAGGVMTWCEDTFSPHPPPQGGQAVPASGDDPRLQGAGTLPTHRMIRGGSFLSSVQQCRCASRLTEPPSRQLPGVGLRLARNIQLLPSEAPDPEAPQANIAHPSAGA